MKEVVIVSYVRTPISRSRPREPERDVFNSVRADELASMVIREVVKRSGIDPKLIDECIFGCANQTAEQYTYGGRLFSLPAGLPIEVSAMSLDRQCASAMSSIHVGAMEIMTGFSDIVVAGGVEHMTHIPMGHGVNPNQKILALEKRFDWLTAFNMGLTAEKLSAESGISRKEQDEWSARSHQLAAKAQAEGFFKGEILPVEVTLPDGKKQIIETDQSIRPDTTVEKLATLPPAFKQPDGIITAGNSSPLNAGAAAVMLMSKEAAKKHGLEPMATIKSIAWAGVDPSVMGKGPVPASKKALKYAKLEVKDIDFWEINEAFAVVTLYAIKQLGINPDIVNVKGGAIALGHPLGMSGTRIVGTLARILEKEGGRRGLATLCVGGGQGAATIIERE
ncbi:MAG: acetyl-CoA C-acetyltransferase [Candidatus Jordarchaeaceae archaeon]